MLGSLCALLLAAPAIGLPAADPITLDGRVGQEEWAAAAAASGEGVELRFMRNGPWLAVALTGAQAYQGELVRIFLTESSGAWVTELLLGAGQPAMPPCLWRRGFPDQLRRLQPGQGYECPRACRVRADFSAADRWSVEYLVRLSALGIGRGDVRPFRGFLVVSRHLPEPRNLFMVPPGNRAPFDTEAYAPFEPQGGWGAGEDWPPVPEEVSREFDDNQLLYRLYREHEATSLREFADTLVVANAVRPRSATRIRQLRNELEDGRRRNPGLTAWSYFTGRLLHEGNHFAEARELIEKVPEPLLHLDPFANLAAEHYLDTQDWEKALAVCMANKKVRGMLEAVKLTLAGRRVWHEEQERLAADAAKTDKNPRVRLVTARGSMLVELFEDDAPHAVYNFMELVLRRQYYDRLRFHEVAGGSYVQIGDPRTRAGSREENDGPPWRLLPDASPRPGLRGYLVTVPLAGAMHGSQFVIAVTPLLDPKQQRFATFGRVVEGLDVLDSLEQDDQLVRVEVVNRRNHPYDALAARLQR